MASAPDQSEDAADPTQQHGGSSLGTGAVRNPVSTWRPSMPVVIAACVAMAAGLLAGLLAWSFASPYGTTPDEDYHMISVWCPHPGQGGCDMVGADAGGGPVVAVPAQFLSRACYLLQSASSVACERAMSNNYVWSGRVNVVGYPGYYYQIMHVFASNDVDRMTLSVRVTNSAIAALLALAVLLLMNAAARRVYVWTVAVTAVAGMAWLVGSAAPDSWSIVGVATVWASITGAFLATVRWRRYGLLATALIGAIVASAARSDGGIYVVIAVAAPCLIDWKRLRKEWEVPAVAAVAAAIGLAGFVSGRQATRLITGGCGVSCPTAPNPHGSLHLLVNNVVYFFEWITDAWRSTFDMQQPFITMFALFSCAVVVVGAALSRGGMTKGKVLALLLTGAVFVGGPVFSLQIGHSLLSMGQGGLAPRYVFPALITLVGAALTPAVSGSSRYLSLRSAFVLWGVVAIVQSVYLHQWMRRCVTGLAGHGFNLSSGAQWWWASGPSPMAMWIIGSVGLAVASAGVVFVWWQPSGEGTIAGLGTSPACRADPAPDSGASGSPAPPLTAASPRASSRARSDLAPAQPTASVALGVASRMPDSGGTPRRSRTRRCRKGRPRQPSATGVSPARTDLWCRPSRRHRRVPATAGW